MAEGHIESYLDGLGYPAKKGEVIDTLKKNGAPSWMIDNADRNLKDDVDFDKFSDVTTTYDKI